MSADPLRDSFFKGGEVFGPQSLTGTALTRAVRGSQDRRESESLPPVSILAID